MRSSAHSKKNGWVDIKEKLPEPNKPVEIFFEGTMKAKYVPDCKTSKWIRCEENKSNAYPVLWRYIEEKNMVNK